MWQMFYLRKKIFKTMWQSLSSPKTDSYQPSLSAPPNHFFEITDNLGKGA
jgi:hypothetical protein